MGQSTDIGKNQNISNVSSATKGIYNQNQNLNNTYDPATITNQLNQGTQAQLTNATNNAISQSSGLVSSQKGINPAMAARLAGQNAASQTQASANQSAYQTAQNAGQGYQLGLGAQGIVSGNLGTQLGTAQQGLNQINSSNASTNNGAVGAVGSAIGGVASGASSAAGFAALADGGVVQKPSTAHKFAQGYANGWGGVGQSLGKGLGALFSSTPPAPTAADPLETAPPPVAFEPTAPSSMDPLASAPPAFAKGGKVPAMVSPGEIYLKPKEAAKVAKGKESPMKGEKIPGKAAVKGNSLQNDTVPKTLEAGGVVIPRSVFDSKNPHKEASKFVAAALMHHKLNKKYGK